MNQITETYYIELLPTPYGLRAVDVKRPNNLIGCKQIESFVRDGTRITIGIRGKNISIDALKNIATNQYEKIQQWKQREAVATHQRSLL